MKRIILLLTVCAVLAFSAGTALAEGDGLTVSLAGPGEAVAAGAPFTVEVTVSGPYKALQATVSYDKDNVNFLPAADYGENVTVSCDAIAGTVTVTRYGGEYAAGTAVSLDFAIYSESEAASVEFSLTEALAGSIGEDHEIPPAAMGEAVSVNVAGVIMTEITEATIDDETVTATLSVLAEEGWQLAAAAYNSSGRMTAVSITQLTVNTVTAELTLQGADTADRVKLFLLDSMWTPLAPVKELVRR